jgi:hypothetical protein
MIMKIALKIILLSVFIFLLQQNIYSQINNSKVTVSVSAIPGVMYSGQTSEINLKVKNISRRNWYPDDLHIRFSGPFRIEIISKPVILEPKESTKISIRITAPAASDIYMLGLVVLNNEKEVYSNVNIIDVMGSQGLSSDY